MFSFRVDPDQMVLPEESWSISTVFKKRINPGSPVQVLFVNILLKSFCYTDIETGRKLAAIMHFF